MALGESYQEKLLSDERFDETDKGINIGDKKMSAAALLALRASGTKTKQIYEAALSQQLEEVQTNTGSNERFDETDKGLQTANQDLNNIGNNLTPAATKEVEEARMELALVKAESEKKLALVRAQARAMIAAKEAELAAKEAELAAKSLELIQERQRASNYNYQEPTVNISAWKKLSRHRMFSGSFEEQVKALNELGEGIADANEGIATANEGIKSHPKGALGSNGRGTATGGGGRGAEG